MEARIRFLSKVSINHKTGCWIWIGAKFSGKNRGEFWFRGTNWQASRAGWELFRGPIPQGRMLCHIRECNNEQCVNPDHLYPGDQHSNMADRDATGRTSRWSHRYNFVQTSALEEKVRTMRQSGLPIEAICKELDIGRTTYYRLRARGVVGEDREIARENYRRAALRR